MKEYNQLSAEELEMIAEFCENEDEYRQMKHVLLSANDMIIDSNESPRKETKDKLDDLFAAQSFPKAAPIWYNRIGVLLYPRDKKPYQRPLFQLAAILLLLLGIVPFLANNNKPLQKEQLAKNETTIPLEENDTTTESIKMDEANAPTAEQKELTGPQLKVMQDNVRVELADDQLSWNDQDQAKAIKPNADFKDMSLVATGASLSKSAEFAKSDGVFSNSNMAAIPSYSIALSEQSEVLDLLTATF